MLPVTAGNRQGTRAGPSARRRDHPGYRERAADGGSRRLGKRNLAEAAANSSSQGRAPGRRGGGRILRNQRTGSVEFLTDGGVECAGRAGLYGRVTVRLAPPCDAARHAEARSIDPLHPLMAADKTDRLCPHSGHFFVRTFRSGSNTDHRPTAHRSSCLSVTMQ